MRYERDHDLVVKHEGGIPGRGGRGPGAGRAGIDGYQGHGVGLDLGLVDDEPEAFEYDRGTDEVRALSDAIEALMAARDRLAAMVD